MKWYCIELALEKANRPVFDSFLFFISKCSLYPTFNFARVPLYYCTRFFVWLSDFPPISWPWYRTWPSPIMSGFHGAFATGVACQQGTLTLPDTWFRPPFWDLLMLQLLRPNSSNLPCLYSTFHLEYPLVLSRFCFPHKTILPYLNDNFNKFTNSIQVSQQYDVKGW